MKKNHKTLGKRNEKANIPEKKLTVKLSWSADVDLDLMAFYRAKDGREGAVYSTRYHGGTMGNIDEFPFLRLTEDAGHDSSTNQKEESLQIFQLSEMEEIHFCTINFTDYSNKSDSSFSSYDAQISITDKKNRPVVVPLDSKTPGTVALIARIENSRRPKLIKENKVMDIEIFQNSIPGAKVLRLDTKKQPSLKKTTEKHKGDEIVSDVSAKLGEEKGSDYNNIDEQYSDPEIKSSDKNEDQIIDKGSDYNNIDEQYSDPEIKSSDKNEDQIIDKSIPNYDTSSGKDSLFKASLLATMYLFIKDRGMNNNLKKLRKAWNKNVLQNEVYKKVKIYPNFLDMLDKTKIFQSCFEALVATYEKNRLSESLFFSELKKSLKTSSEHEHKQLVEIMLNIAFADEVVTKNEKEAMRQLVNHLEIQNEIFDSMFKKKEEEIKSKIDQRMKKRRLKVIIASFGLLFAIISWVILDSTDQPVNLKLISADIPRHKNIYPLRRMIAFKVDLKFDVANITDMQRKKLCESLMIKSDNFVLTDCEFEKYENNRLAIEVEAHSKNAGEKTLALKFKENSSFEIEGEIAIPSIFQERIADCSQYLESRYDSAREFESGKEFASCINDWMITHELQGNQAALTEPERVIPQHNFDLFLSNFIHSSKRPKNIFNWFFGVLSIQPKKEYIPYLVIFQKACLRYLKKITEPTSPLIAFFEGKNPDIDAYYKELSENLDSMITCAGVEEIGETDFLRENLVFREIEKIRVDTLKYEGDRVSDEGNYHLKNRNIELSTEIDKVWVFNHRTFNKKIGFPYRKVYNVTDTRGINSDLCAYFNTYFPKHSLGSFIELSNGTSCETFGEIGVDFKSLFNTQKHDADEDMISMAQFIYSDFISEYSYNSKKYSDSYGKIFLLALASEKSNDHLFLNYLAQTKMENGEINIVFEEAKLYFLHIGALLIYGYDISNYQFGVILDLSQPTFDGGYVEAHGNFFPLD